VHPHRIHRVVLTLNQLLVLVAASLAIISRHRHNNKIPHHLDRTSVIQEQILICLEQVLHLHQLASNLEQAPHQLLQVSSLVEQPQIQQHNLPYLVVPKQHNNLLGYLANLLKQETVCLEINKVKPKLINNLVFNLVLIIHNLKQIQMSILI